MNDQNFTREMTVLHLQRSEAYNQWELNLVPGGKIVSDRRHLNVIYLASKRHVYRVKSALYSFSRKEKQHVLQQVCGKGFQVSFWFFSNITTIVAKKSEFWLFSNEITPEFLMLNSIWGWTILIINDSWWFIWGLPNHMNCDKIKLTVW